MSVCCECCVLSGKGLCDYLITRPEESYRLGCVDVCDLEKITIVNEDECQGPLRGYRAKRKKNKRVKYGVIVRLVLGISLVVKGDKLIFILFFHSCVGLPNDPCPLG